MTAEHNEHLEQEAREMQRRKKLSEIESVSHDSHQDPESEQDLDKMVDGPLLRACKKLYRDNIQTYVSSANKSRIEWKTVYFSIIYDALSEKNRERVKKLEEQGRVRVVPPNGNDRNSLVLIDIPVTAETTWGEIEDAAENIVKQFEKQRLIAHGYTDEYLIKFLTPVVQEDNPDGNISPEYFEKHGYFYDPESDTYFKGKEDRRRALEPLPGEDSDQPLQLLSINGLQNEGDLL